ncbi:MAG: SprT family zinc-dependent metalloprotease [Thermodesulfovibrionales bacterium]|nr:SprT family zinc-dependent metalloprotease [Thermodesulfovibrionales bacterium]
MTEIKIDKIIRSKRRTIALEVARDASLVVRAPYRTPLYFIEKVVFKKRFWIKEKQEFVRNRYEKIVLKEFVSGEGFLYLGNTYKLEFVDISDISIEFNNNFQISRKYSDTAKELLIAWYKEQAYHKISERVDRYASMTGLKYTEVKISDAQKRWGSCSAKGNLNFSWRLIMAPLRVIDYVVVHELAHLEEKNHSKKFWNKIKIMMPDYEHYKDWLKENRHLLVI